jgi:hypothetical protein
VLTSIYAARRFERFKQAHPKPEVNPPGVPWKRIKWLFCEDTSSSELKSIKESLDTLIAEWKVHPRKVVVHTDLSSDADLELYRARVTQVAHLEE